MKHLILFASLALFIVNNALGQTALRKKHFNIEKGTAIQGYDPVAYFVLGKAVEGKKELAVITEGITYYFSSQKNKELFIKDPKKYEPQYGGWCAYAMGANNEKVEIDPETFKIVDGKLYLFYHSWTNNTLTKWNENEKNLKIKADKNWLKIYK
jgi:YHS domain-containing protein